MNRKRIGLKSQGKRTIPIIISILVLLAASAIGSPIVPEPQTTTLKVKYEIWGGGGLDLCVGEEELFNMVIFRWMYPIGESRGDPEAVAGGTIEAFSSDTNVGDFVGSQYVGPIGAINLNPTGFLFEARQEGQTKIKFTASSTGDPSAWGRAKPKEWTVYVRSCYEAYASGLVTGNVANVWIEKRICDLNQPFSLEYKGAAQGTGGDLVGTDQIDSVSSHFAPDLTGLLTPYNGAFISEEKHNLTLTSSTGTSKLSCSLLSGGGYKIEWKDPNKKTNGDIVLEGLQRNSCAPLGPVFNVNLRIAFRALDPATIIEYCAEE